MEVQVSLSTGEPNFVIKVMAVPVLLAPVKMKKSSCEDEEKLL